MIDNPRGERVYRNPYQTLTRTRDFFAELPQFAVNVRRLWFDGLYVPETDAQIIEILHSCRNLTTVTLPWTLLRNASPRDWAELLGVRQAAPLHTLELHAIDLPEKQAQEVLSVTDQRPLDSRMVDFSQLRRLKLFGDTKTRPINDDDLKAIARTATSLEDFQITCMSTVTLDGVMAIVKASRNTLRVLEHSPRAQDGFSHPHPGVYSENEHICDILTSCPKLQDLSISLPSMCASLFSNTRVLWKGDCQVRALHLCGHEEGSTSNAAIVAMKDLLRQARRLITCRANAYFPEQLTIELFFGDYIFDPHIESVHGDFSMAELISQGTWPSRKMLSRKGPYGTTGLYGKKDEEHPFDRVSEDDFFSGVGRTLVQL
ncbi:hypothetical protein, variant [Verruconis gallopava]|nr:hypothetical protein, variant [Verruconis gallopava]KIW07950.1 hypothetical protein, variant [Verruconis gallopava]